jgi:hypothetical protein
MKVEQNFSLNGAVVWKTNKTLLGCDVYCLEENDGDLVLYVVDSDFQLKATITAKASSTQGQEYIDIWDIENH